MLAEYQVICKILQTKDYGIIKTNNLTSDYFYKFKEQFIFIEEHYRKFGVIPDILTVYGKFP